MISFLMRDQMLILGSPRRLSPAADPPGASGRVTLEPHQLFRSILTNKNRHCSFQNVTGVQGDVSNVNDLDRLFAQIKAEKGRLDILFANAGIARYSPLGRPSGKRSDMRD